MASNAAASSVPPGLQQGPQPSSPHTPNRFLSSNFSSPGTTFRPEDDAVIIELGSRFLRAGYEGEHSPQCVIDFGPDQSHRVGDYRHWGPGGRKKNYHINTWGQDHEFWQMDLTDVDLGLVGDKLERAVGEVYSHYLLSDVGSARLVLVLPSVLPHPLLSTVIATLFNRWKYPKICLLPSPTMAAVGAGLRSALVVDIGWSETIITAIYEYREVQTRRSSRAMRFLLREAGTSLIPPREGDQNDLRLDFDLAEELMTRMAWCKEDAASDTATEDDGITVADPSEQQMSSQSRDSVETVEIDWPVGSSSMLVKLPFRLFSEPVERAFLVLDTPSQLLDDHEHSLPMLVYETLQALSADARAMCMSRIVFVGGGSHIPGLAPRIVREAAALVELHGWSAVRASKVVIDRTKLGRNGHQRGKKPDASFKEPMHPGEDDVEEKVRKQRVKEDAQTVVQGEFRQVESLGAWAGASLLANMKIQGLVEIERETFQQHGLAGAHSDMAVSVVPQRTSYWPGLARGARDRVNWTLAGWA